MPSSKCLKIEHQEIEFGYISYFRATYNVALASYMNYTENKYRID